MAKVNVVSALAQRAYQRLPLKSGFCLRDGNFVQSGIAQKKHDGQYGKFMCKFACRPQSLPVSCGTLPDEGYPGINQ
jgi:hypothetical protein